MSAKLTPMKAIREKCLDCCCGAFREVRLCSAQKCPLYPYRMGHRPKEGTDTSEDLENENPQVAPHFLENSTK